MREQLIGLEWPLQQALYQIHGGKALELLQRLAGVGLTSVDCRAWYRIGWYRVVCQCMRHPKVMGDASKPLKITIHCAAKHNEPYKYLEPALQIIPSSNNHCSRYPSPPICSDTLRLLICCPRWKIMEYPTQFRYILYRP